LPKVELETPYPGTRWGAKISLDGREVPDVASIVMKCVPDAIVSIELEVLVTEQFQFAGDALVHITATVPPGYVLIKETSPEGVETWRAEKIDEK
jgi:hypothetical protein